MFLCIFVCLEEQFYAEVVFLDRILTTYPAVPKCQFNGTVNIALKITNVASHKIAALLYSLTEQIMSMVEKSQVKIKPTTRVG